MVEDFPRCAILKWHSAHVDEWNYSNDAILERAVELNDLETLHLLKGNHYYINSSKLLYPAARSGKLDVLLPSSMHYFLLSNHYIHKLFLLSKVIKWGIANGIVPEDFDFGFYFQRAVSFLKLDVAKVFYSLGVHIDKMKFINSMMVPILRNRVGSPANTVKLLAMLDFLVNEAGCAIDDRFHLYACRFKSAKIVEFGYIHNPVLTPECFQEAIVAFRKDSSRHSLFDKFKLKEQDLKFAFVSSSDFEEQNLQIISFLISKECAFPEDFLLYCLKQLAFGDFYVEEDEAEEGSTKEALLDMEVHSHRHLKDVLDFMLRNGVTVTPSCIEYALNVGLRPLVAFLQNSLTS